MTASCLNAYRKAILKHKFLFFFIIIIAYAPLFLAFKVGLSTATLSWLLTDANSLNTLSHTPSARHLLSLFQAVLYKPQQMGISIHLHPVMRTYRIPFITRLSSALGLPAPALGGNRCLISSYSQSLSSRNSIQNHSQKSAVLNDF